MKSTPPNNSIPAVPAIRFRVAFKTEGVIFSKTQLFRAMSNKMARTLSKINPTETLAKASFGESI